ncbi:FadR/GntR family transcriptional regulator [Glacieibacterium frigidum]|uniref:FadR family transcriptional regulator n=1 Tax=Glacieibacterium frigidum TaxID=2593303 RepID=A0A552UGL6_9SPHN|nr:FadR/GntR family transcriptional regulator [Glacieibacterium frigidum]TRW17331.1 FadR family transcriptional regulator [Glacieibacterium frigidum]
MLNVPFKTETKPVAGPRAPLDPGAVKLSDIVYAKIAGRIRSGEYSVDSRLPTENDLAEALGVSRPIVREALARLRNDGVVMSRRGSGTYVQRVQDTVPSRMPPLTSISDMKRCLEYRISLEGESAWHAARGAAEDRVVLTEAMARLDRDFEHKTLEPDNDFAFHHAVALATGNRFFHETMSSMRETIITAMQITPNFISPRSHDRLATLHKEHQAVYLAVMANDAEGARDAMRTHLTRAMQRVFDGL